jgi:hypothetical protein
MQDKHGFRNNFATIWSHAAIGGGGGENTPKRVEEASDYVTPPDGEYEDSACLQLVAVAMAVSVVSCVHPVPFVSPLVATLAANSVLGYSFYAV